MFEWLPMNQEPPRSNAYILFYRSCGEYVHGSRKEFAAIIDEFDDLVAYKILAFPPELE